MELGEHAEQQRDADGDRSGGDRQPHEGLPAAAHRQPQAQAEHYLTAFAAELAGEEATDDSSACAPAALPDEPRSAATRPSRTMTTRSAYAATRASWVMSTTVVPCSRASAVSRSITFSPVSESSDPVGSSAKMSFGASARARATATRCASPPESSPVRRLPLSPMPSRSSHASAVLYAAFRLVRFSSNGSATLSAAVSSGTSCPNWKTKPKTVLRSRVRSASLWVSRRWPSNHTSPWSGWKMPAIQCSRVDLPDPLGPMIARISPWLVATLAPRSAGVWPKDLRTSRASIRRPRMTAGGVIAFVPPQLVPPAALT